ncbi:hypothetical protein [Francisella tularensis]|uniref:hypothetical protein n=1 Tax=Francisella tularensis TaxID=263 RepID=UPI0002F21223|nr:hypothetical protein [Francisella tularensis]KFJ38548.1 succinylglutamate desuccinylase / Aspartoacylase family domain protein [Francisella tularensis]KFJ44223.1 succinylglutamate desuccinylase / Aspartoacylase family domain protein [Francisella tularensis]MBK2013566.1 hypothetical protein [Francisella tularensis subsp. tularensis]MBK2016410.1 hypothetical protein [Francisella tularensis subsp. tularensis]MBK2017596.1 hypothetical protein [Francisella tularensis subsp. tularensis]
MSNYISKQKIKVSQLSTGEDIHVEKINIKGFDSSAPCKLVCMLQNYRAML